MGAMQDVFVFNVALTPMRGAAPVATAPMLAPVSLVRVPQPSMVELDDASKSFYDEYMSSDPATGEKTALSLGEKGARATRLAPPRHALSPLFFLFPCLLFSRSHGVRRVDQAQL